MAVTDASHVIQVTYKSSSYLHGHSNNEHFHSTSVLLRISILQNENK